MRLQQHQIYLDGLRLSKRATQSDLPHNIAGQDVSSIEDIVDQTEPGTVDSQRTATIFGATDWELRILDDLRSAAGPYPWTNVYRPAAGQIAISKLVTLLSRGEANARTSPRTHDLTTNSESDPRHGTVLHHTDEGGLITVTGNSGSLNLGALAAGQVLTLTTHVFDPPGVAGTGTRTLAITLESSALGTFADAIVRATLDVFTTDAPGAGEVAAPGSIWTEIDGDTTPVSDPHWRIAWVVGGAGTGPEWPLLSVISILNKI